MTSNKAALDQGSLLRGIALVLIVLLGLEMRLTAVELTVVDTPLRADALDYFGYAWNIANEGTYARLIPGISAAPDTELVADFTRSPGFPLLAALFASDNIPTFYLDTLNAQLVLNALILLPALLLGWRSFGYWPTLATGLLYATAPHLISMNLYFLSESLMVSLMVAFVTLLYLALRGGGMAVWALLGLCLAYAALTRPYMQYFILLLLPWLLWEYRRERKAKIWLFALCFAIVSGAWSLYVKSQGGQGDDILMVGTIHHGLYPDLMFEDNPATYGYPYRFDPAAAEVSKDMGSVLTELQRRLRTEPLNHLRWYLVGKPLTLWQWPLIQGTREIYVYPVATPPWDYLGHFQLTLLLHKLLHYPLLLAALVFTLLVWVPRFALALPRNQLLFYRALALLLFYSTVIHMVGAPFPRYQIPQKFIVYVMAIACIGHLVWPALHTRLAAKPA
jgi:4-amino-4-deoxy-L-arabinose transferase-like glycosyltransferase